MTQNPFDFFDAIYCINQDKQKARWQKVLDRLSEFDIADRVQRFSADSVYHLPKNRISIQQDVAISHCTIVKICKKQGLKNVLIFEDDVKFITNDLIAIRNSIDTLRKIEDWNIFYLGMNLLSSDVNLINEHLAFVRKSASVKLKSTHAYAVNHIAFDDFISFREISIDRSKGKWEHIDIWIPMTFDSYIALPLLSVQDQGFKEFKFRRNYYNSMGGKKVLWEFLYRTIIKWEKLKRSLKKYCQVNLF